MNYMRDADKSLVRPTPQCRKTESIVSLDRGVCSCYKLQIFSCYKGSLSGDARDFNHIETRALIKFSFLECKASKEIHANLRETLGEYAPLYATVKNFVAQFKHRDFSTCYTLRHLRPKPVTTP